MDTSSTRKPKERSDLYKVVRQSRKALKDQNYKIVEETVTVAKNLAYGAACVLCDELDEKEHKLHPLQSSWTRDLFLPVAMGDQPDLFD